MAIKSNDDIIQTLGLDGLDIDKKVDLLERMTDIVQKRIALRVVKLMPNKSLSKYLEMKDDDEAEAQKLLVETVPNYYDIVEEEISIFKQEVTA